MHGQPGTTHGSFMKAGVYLSIGLWLCVGACSAELPGPEQDRPSLPGGLADQADMLSDSALDAISDSDNTEMDTAEDADTTDTVEDMPQMDPNDGDQSTSPYARDCAELMGQIQTGFHDIDPDQDGQPLFVWCDMDTAGGGWTLVARSDDSGSLQGEGFGWMASSGTAANNYNEPYSMGVNDAGLRFTEILVGSRTDDQFWSDAYALEVSPDFLKECADTPCQPISGPTQVVDGECSGAEPTMLNWLGYINITNGFWFRDNSSLGQFGLNHRAWSTNYDNCFQGGGLLGVRGMIMVR